MTEISIRGQALALELVGLSSALEQGSPLPLSSSPALKQLSVDGSEGGEDGVVKAAIGALPTSAISKGVATRAELEAEFRRTRRVLAELSYFKGSTSGEWLDKGWIIHLSLMQCPS